MAVIFLIFRFMVLYAFKEAFFLFVKFHQGNINFPLNMAVQINDTDLVIKIIKEFKDENVVLSNDCGIPVTTNRRISTQAAMANLGLPSIVDQKNERGMSPMHIAACLGNELVFYVAG